MKRRMLWLGVLLLSSGLAAILVLAITILVGALWLKGYDGLPTPISDEKVQAR